MNTVISLFYLQRKINTCNFFLWKQSYTYSSHLPFKNLFPHWQNMDYFRDLKQFKVKKINLSKLNKTIRHYVKYFI